jgi:hypothetical protein
MRLLLTSSLLLGLLACPSIAQTPRFGPTEPAASQFTAPEFGESEQNAKPKQLLARIVELEKRIAKLEAMLRRQAVVTPPSYKPQHSPQPPLRGPEIPPGPYPQPTAPMVPAPLHRPFPHQTPQYLPPQSQPPRSQTVPPPPLPPEQVPKNWQRFEFNGRSFYIVPTDEVLPGNRSRR